MMEVGMEIRLIYGSEYVDHTGGYVTINGKRTGPKINISERQIVADWLRRGGTQDIFDCHNDCIDAMFKERENGKA
jgi:hypothetical protein